MLRAVALGVLSPEERLS